MHKNVFWDERGVRGQRTILKFEVEIKGYSMKINIRKMKVIRINDRQDMKVKTKEGKTAGWQVQIFEYSEIILAEVIQRLKQG